MTSWGDSLKNNGTAITPAFAVGKGYNCFLLHTEINSELNEGEIKIEYSLSHRDSQWSSWQKIYNKNSLVIENEENKEVKVKFRLIFVTNDLSKSPKLYSFVFKNKNLHKVVNVGELKCKPRLWIRKTKDDGD